MSKAISTNVRSSAFFDGVPIAEHERRRHGAVIADLRNAWGQQSSQLITRVPEIVRYSAPKLSARFSSELAQALARIVSSELAHTSRRIDAIDNSLAGMLDAEADLAAIHAILKTGFRPLAEFVRDTASLFDRIANPKLGAGATPDKTGTTIAQVPLIALARGGKSALTHLARIIFAAQSLTPLLTEIISRNLARATGYDPTDDKRALPSPHSLDGGADAVATLIFADTPFLRLLLTPVPIRIPRKIEYEHRHILAKPGWGKTQLLQLLIANYLAEPVPPALVIIDSQGDMLDVIQRLALFAPGQGRLADKLIIINPRDIAHPPAINLFALNRNTQGRIDPVIAEEIANGTIELMDTIYGAILGAELTQMQTVLSRMLTHLLFTIPGATILTLRDLLEDPTPFKPYIDAMPGEVGHFLRKNLLKASPKQSSQYDETREQILRRLWGLIEQQSFARMLAAPELRVDLYDCLQSGKIVLINTAIDFLQPQRSAVMGRIFVALALQATLRRAAIPRDRRRPAFLILDEAQQYLDNSVGKFLEMARKFNVGLIAAHQDLSQLTPAIAAALASRTSIKMAGGISDRDAHALARDLRATPDQLLGLERGVRSSQFATYVSGVTAAAIPISIPFGTLEALPQMTTEQHRQLIAANRRRISAPAPADPRAPPARPPGAPPTRPPGTPPTKPSPPPTGKGTPAPTIPKRPDDWWS